MLVIASRGSQLALWQARWVEAQLAAAAATSAASKSSRPPATRSPTCRWPRWATKGLFTKEIEEALLDGRADLAVHSLKDLPTELPEGLVLAAVPEREDPRDALVGSGSPNCRAGARVGTSSLRRAAQLRKLRPDLAIESVRGNLDTRLRKLDEGQYDAILLAAAGLKRLGWGGPHREILPAGDHVPGRGAGRAGDRNARRRRRASTPVPALDHAATRAAVTAERGRAGARWAAAARCRSARTPRWRAGACTCCGVVASPDGARAGARRSEGAGGGAEAHRAARWAKTLLERGAAPKILREPCYT